MSWRVRVCAFACALVFAWAFAAYAAAPVLVDEVVAAVGARALTRSQVIAEARAVLAEKGEDWTAPLTQGLLESILDAEIAKELLYQEMERLGVAEREVSGVEVGNALTAFTEKVGGPKALRDFLDAGGFDAAALSARLSRLAKIEGFLSQRLALSAAITPQEVDEEFAARGLKTLVKQYPEKEAGLREELARELASTRRQRALSELIDALKQRTRVRRVVAQLSDVPALKPPTSAP